MSLIDLIRDFGRYKLSLIDIVECLIDKIKNLIDIIVNSPFTREFGPFTREFRQFTREFALFTHEFDRLLLKGSARHRLGLAWIPVEGVWPRFH